MRKRTWPRRTMSPSRNATWVTRPLTCAATFAVCIGSTVPFAVTTFGAGPRAVVATVTGTGGGGGWGAGFEHAATQQVRTSDELLASATESMRASQARYTAGVASILDLLTAQAMLASARAQQAQARWAWAQSLARLGYAAGALDTRGRAAVPVAPDTTRSALP